MRRDYELQFHRQHQSIGKSDEGVRDLSSRICKNSDAKGIASEVLPLRLHRGLVFSVFRIPGCPESGIQSALGLTICVLVLIGFAKQSSLFCAESELNESQSSAIAGAWSALHDPELEVKRRAIEYLIEFDALEAVPPQHQDQLQISVRELCQAEKTRERWIAANALAYDSAMPSVEAVDWLFRLAENGLAEPAVKSLGERALHSNQALRKLVELVSSRSGDARIEAAGTLHRISSKVNESLNPDAIDPIWSLQLLVDEGGKHWDVSAADMLGQLQLSSVAKRKVLPGMMVLLRHPQRTEMQKVAVATAILRLNPESTEAVDVLTKFCNARKLSPFIREGAAAALIKWSPRGRDEATKAIKQMARQGVLYIGNLHELAVNSEGLLTTTLELTRDLDEQVKLSAIQSLASVAKDSDSPEMVVQRLLEIIADQDLDDYVRADAIQPLSQLVPQLQSKSKPLASLRKLIDFEQLKTRGEFDSIEVAAAVIFGRRPDCDHPAGPCRICGFHDIYHLNHCGYKTSAI